MPSLFESLTGLTLLDPWLLPLGLLVAAGLWARWRRGSPTVRFAPGPFLEPGLPTSWRIPLLPLPRVLQVLALLLLVVALARPARRTPLPLSTEGIDILLCVDVSSSMSADDMDARRSRLEVAKDAAAEFAAGRTHDRIGLVSFARFPDVRCPPTLDHEALGAFLIDTETVDPDGPEDATGIGTAVARAAEVLGGDRQGGGAGTSRVVILLTDGEENVAIGNERGEISPLHAAQLCERLGVRVYTVAVGVSDEIDTTQVERLSERTGGRFYAARDAAAVASVYSSIDELERVELAEPRYRIEEAFLPFLTLALTLLLASRLLVATVLRVVP